MRAIAAGRILRGEARPEFLGLSHSYRARIVEGCNSGPALAADLTMATAPRGRCSVSEHRHRWPVIADLALERKKWFRGKGMVLKRFLAASA